MVIPGHASEVARFRQRAPVHLWVFWESAAGGKVRLYCFEKPQVNVNSNKRVDSEDITTCGFDSNHNLTGCGVNGTTWQLPWVTWQEFAAAVTGAASEYPDTCYICGCLRFRRLLRTWG